MKTFKDLKGRTWDININYSTIKRIKDLLGINITDLINIDKETNLDISLLTRYASDIVLLIDTLYCICKDQADKLNITDVEFGESFSGEEADNALNALVEEVINFFPTAKKTLLNKVFSAVRKKEMEIHQKAIAAMMSQEFDEKLESLMTKLNN
jgi:hypothetical protein